MLLTRLSWRIPTTGDPRWLRLGLAQVALATIVAATVLCVAAPRTWLVSGLLGLIPLAVFMAFRRWHAYNKSLQGEDNVWIDDRGLHWLDAHGQEQVFARGDILGFKIDRHADTLRPVEALTLRLGGGFETQPIELHPPATPGAVRDWLAASWQLTEFQPAAENQYDELAVVYGECHEEFQEWHWEGTREELAKFFAFFAAAAGEFPPPPAGVKPLTKIVLASRRQPSRVHIGHASRPHVDPEAIVASGATLRQISQAAVQTLAQIPGAGDGKFDVRLSPRSVWTFHLHVHAA